MNHDKGFLQFQLSKYYEKMLFSLLDYKLDRSFSNWPLKG